MLFCIESNSLQENSSRFHTATHKAIISNRKVVTIKQIKSETEGETKAIPIAFMIGTAGSGKSLFTAALSEWLKVSKQDVAIVNLDPGVLKLQYSPDVDVRNYVDVSDLIEKYGLARANYGC